MPTIAAPYIPSTITVHLGPPASNAQNVSVSFPDYIKNVASSEIYPTWPESALRANIYAQISFALNRIYTEFYRNQGYAFDITNSTAYDQSYVQGRDVFENISVLVDEMFNSYVRRQGASNPISPSTATAPPSPVPAYPSGEPWPWPTPGYTPYQILTNYYGNDIEIVRNAPVRINSPSYPGRVLRMGDGGNEVRSLQIRLNRISRNYPSIPKINPVTPVFNQQTEDAVAVFQRVFNLPVTGEVDEATWYKIGYLYTGVKRLSELDSEGLSFEKRPSSTPLSFSWATPAILSGCYSIIWRSSACFMKPSLPSTWTASLGRPPGQAVIAFQKTYGLNPDGIVGRQTWNEILRAYRGIVDSGAVLEGGQPLYPGVELSEGSTGPNVLLMQQYLNRIAQAYPSIPILAEDGVYGPAMRDAVYAFQNQFGLEETGTIGPITWGLIVSLYSDLTLGGNNQIGQYPGYELQEAAT